MSLSQYNLKTVLSNTSTNHYYEYASNVKQYVRLCQYQFSLSNNFQNFHRKLNFIEKLQL